MKHQAVIRVYGMQEIDGQTQNQEITLQGEYYEQYGKRFVLYQEEIEGIRKSVRTLVKESEKCIEVVKNGGISVKMYFEKGKSVTSNYETPMGSIALRIVTKDIKKEAKEKGFLWELSYSLYMDGQYVGENVLGLDVELC